VENSTGALDLPGTAWRDRPQVDRGNGVYLVGDMVAAPGLLTEVSFNSALAAVAFTATLSHWRRVKRPMSSPSMFSHPYVHTGVGL
jgi:hypothetical protein